MTVSACNHFTILTDDLPATLAFYEEHLNLKPGAPLVTVSNLRVPRGFQTMDFSMSGWLRLIAVA